MQDLIKVKVSTSNPNLQSLLLRQTPSRAGLWGKCEFHVDKPIDSCDWWIVCHESALKEAESIRCDPNHILFFSMEPLEGRNPPRHFYEQFAAVVLTDESILHPNVIRRNVVTWWAGIEVHFENRHKFTPNINVDYDGFKKMSLPEKINRISVITSSNKSLPGHLKRLEFIRRLRGSSIAKHIDFFGAGHNPIPDKIDGLLPYKYHLVLENCSIPDYWSEKLADPLLAFCLPIYYGCPNIEKYFPAQSFVKIDIESFDQAIEILEKTISNDMYSSCYSAICSARSKILDEYNIFEIMSNLCNAKANQLELCTLKPKGFFLPWPRLYAGKVYHGVRNFFLS